MRRGLFIAAVLVQALVLVAWSASLEWELAGAERIRLEVVQRDPRDLLRGDYVSLQYVIADIPLETIAGVRRSVRSTHLYANRAAAFRRVTFPLALPGVFAGSLLTFIPAMGDYINAELLGNPQTRMIGNAIQNRLLLQNDYPVGSALSFILMAAILAAVVIYARLLGTEQLTG